RGDQAVDVLHLLHGLVVEVTGDQRALLGEEVLVERRLHPLVDLVAHADTDLELDLLPADRRDVLLGVVEGTQLVLDDVRLHAAAADLPDVSGIGLAYFEAKMTTTIGSIICSHLRALHSCKFIAGPAGMPSAATTRPKPPTPRVSRP